MKPVARFIDFAEAGTFGDAGNVLPLNIGENDGLAIEAGGMFQGYSFTTLELYAFKAGQIVHLIASPSITISTSNAGAVTDDRDVITVTGSWSVPAVPGNELIVDYKIKAHGRSRGDRLVWTLTDSRLPLTNGRLPAELTLTGGG